MFADSHPIRYPPFGIKGTRGYSLFWHVYMVVSSTLPPSNAISHRSQTLTLVSPSSSSRFSLRTRALDTFGADHQAQRCGGHHSGRPGTWSPAPGLCIRWCWRARIYDGPSSERFTSSSQPNCSSPSPWPPSSSPFALSPTSSSLPPLAWGSIFSSLYSHLSVCFFDLLSILGFFFRDFYVF